MRVVLVDDEAMVLKSVEAALAEYGFKVTPFKEPQKALDWIAANGADIVITDIRMPQLDGFDVLKKVKEIDPNCDVIFITAHGQMDIAIRAIRGGVTDFFEKPFSTQALCAAMERTRRFRLIRLQRDILTDQVTLLSRELLDKDTSRHLMLGNSAAMKKIAADMIEIAATDATVVITGESGSGKELIAAGIHRASKRAAKPFLTVNCPSIPEDLFESEMFGHRRGSYTGAVETRGGYVEASSGGTLFLDEIGDLPLKAQAKILRLMEQKTYMPVGEQKEREADVRVIAATNQSLEQLVKEKRFREDLYYRLNVCPIHVPPLRERREDIPLLALYFTLKYAENLGKNIGGIDDDAIQILTGYDYPGNVRELRNIIESTVIRCRHPGKLARTDLPEFMLKPPDVGQPVSLQGDSIKFVEVEKRLYQESLNRSGGNVSAAARLLGLSRGKLRRRMADLGITAKEP